MSDLNGFINLHKPKGWSSHDCVARVRRLLNTKKVGHGGTLDPLASGVLPIAVGRATRLIQYLPSRKAYWAIIRFGTTTTTDDLEGAVLTQQSAAHLQLSDIEALLPQFTGLLLQTPPVFSAVQVGGQRLYDLARKGQTVEVPTREVTVEQLKILDWQGGLESPELTLAVECGPGTYIRSIARDMGAAVGTGATLAGLVRSHSSGFELSTSLTIEALERAIAQGTFQLTAASKAVQHLPAVTLAPDLAERWCMGQKLSLMAVGLEMPPSLSADSGPLRVLCEGAFLGIGEIREDIEGGDRTALATSERSSADLALNRLALKRLAPKMVFTPR